MEILFFKIKQKIFLKDDVILIAKFKEITGPFILGKLAQNLKRSSPKVKTLLYASDPELRLSNIQLRVHRLGRETSYDWNRLGSVVHRPEGGLRKF